MLGSNVSTERDGQTNLLSAEAQLANDVLGG